jgi:transcriptional regulator with XRE-family HTH domain
MIYIYIYFLLIDTVLYIRMSYSTQYISRQLKKTRENRGLSQRELSARSGIPQGHISKIESGNVDLRLSSLVAIARVLELEFALIPRKHLSAINSIVGRANSKSNEEPPRPAYSLDGKED